MCDQCGGAPPCSNPECPDPADGLIVANGTAVPYCREHGADMARRLTAASMN